MKVGYLHNKIIVFWEKTYADGKLSYVYYRLWETKGSHRRKLSSADLHPPGRANVHLTSIHNPQIEGIFTKTPGGLTNMF